MRWTWPWRRRHSEPRRLEGNGHAAANAKADAERKLREAHRLWPDVLAARDELARLAEQAMRGQR